MEFVDIVFVYQLKDERLISWHGRKHAHPGTQREFHYFISGQGYFINGDANVPIEAGSLHLTSPGVEHRIVATSPRHPITYYAILFDARDDAELLDLLVSLGEGGAFPRHWRIGTRQRFFFAELLEKSVSRKRGLWLSAMHAFISFLYGLAASDSAEDAACRDTPDNVHVERALAIMQGSVESSLSLDDICSRLSVSREHFARVFTRSMGIAPMHWFSRLKTEAAKAMLSNTKLRIGEISEKLGFENQFSFSRTFKNHAAMTPSAYRAACLLRSGLL